MNTKILILILINLFPVILLSQDSCKYTQSEGSLDNHGMKLPYTICYPNNIKKAPVVLLIAGSGPTNKDGNNFFMTNNHLKFLAEELAENGIASFRYDKRIIPGNNEINEADYYFIEALLRKRNLEVK